MSLPPRRKFVSLRYALLIALHESPASGYDLTARFRGRLAHVWSASHQQIYRELGKLHEEGKLAMTEVPQLDRPDRKVYQVAAAGEEDLRQWLATPQPSQATRDPLLVKLFAGNLLDRAAMLAEVAERRAETREQLDTFRAIEREYFADLTTLSTHFRLQHLALRRGITSMEAQLAWLDEVEAALPVLTDGPSRQARGRGSRRGTDTVPG
jgi:PadR family transcriptional regulator, regulatory protein AphA